MCMTQDQKHAKLAADLAQQEKEADSKDNRYFAGLHYGREVTDPAELMLYYIEHGGATGHRLRVAALRKAEAEASQPVEP